MFVHKLPTVVAVLLTVGLIGAGAAWLQSHPAGAAQPVAADAPKADPALAKDREQPRPGERARHIRRQLTQYVSVDAFEANTTLWTAARLLSKKFNIPIDIDKNAFAAIGVQKVEECPVELPKMTDVRLGAILRRVLSQVKGDQYTGAYVVRPDRVELTTSYHQWLEAGADPNPPAGSDLEGNDPIVPRELGYLGPLRRPTAVIHVDYERQSLAEACAIWRMIPATTSSLIRAWRRKRRRRSAWG